MLISRLKNGRKLVICIFLCVMIFGLIVFHMLNKDKAERIQIIPEGNVTYRGGYVDNVWYNVDDTVVKSEGWIEDPVNGTYTADSGAYLELQMPKGERRLVFNADPNQGTVRISCNGKILHFILASEESISYGKAYEIPDPIGRFSLLCRFSLYFAVLLLIDCVICAVILVSLNLQPLFTDYKKNIVTAAAIIVAGTHLWLTISGRKIVSPVTSESIVPSFFYGCLIFTGILLVLTALLIITIYGQTPKREWRIYWLCVGIVICSICIRNPRSTWQAEPYWETTTNFIWQTYARPWIDALMLDDAAYWTLLPRVLAIFVIKICGQVQLAPIILQMCVGAFLAVVSAKLVKPELSQYGCIENRILICFLFGTTVGFITAIKDLHNITYIGGLLVALCFLSDMDKISRRVYVADCIIAFGACCSKPQIGAFLPAFLLYIVYCRKNINRRKLRFLVISSFGCILSLIYYIAGLGEAGKQAPFHGNVLGVMFESFYEMLQAILSTVLTYKSQGYFAGGLMNLILIIAIAVIGIHMIKQQRARVIQCLCLGAFGVGTIVINLIGYNKSCDFMTILQRFMMATGYPFERNNYLALIAAVLILMIVLTSGIFGKKEWHQMAAMVFGLTFLLRLSFQPQNISANTSVQLNWTEYSSALEEESYGIPANTSAGGFLLKNAKTYYYGNQDVWCYDGHFSSGPSKVIAVAEPISSLNFETEETLLAIYTNKRYLGGVDPVVMNIYDSSHTLLQSVQAIEEYDRFAVGFILDEPCYDAVSIEFINKNTGNPYYYDSHLFTVIEKPGAGISAFAGWRRQSIEE